MKLPSKIKLLGLTHKVKFSNREGMAEVCNVGEYQPINQNINIRQDQCDEQLLQSLMHEIVHAIDYMTNGSGGFSLSEEQTDRIALGFTSLLLNNKVGQWL